MGKLIPSSWWSPSTPLATSFSRMLRQHYSVQPCRNRLHSLIEKYQVEKKRVRYEPGYVSTWRFFNHFDSFLFKHHTNTPLLARRLLTPAREVKREMFPAVTTARGVAPVINLKRKMFSADEEARGVVPPAVMTARGVLPPPRYTVPVTDSSFSRWQSSSGKRLKGNVNGRRRVEKKVRDDYRQVAEAIERFVGVYEKVEEAKRRQLLELGKQRMRFTKDLEIQRIRLLMESQVQLQKLMKS